MWATAPVLIRLGLRDVKDPVLLNGVRSAVALAVYAPVLLALGVGDLTANAVLWIAVSALMGPGLGDVLFIASIDRLGAGPPTIIAYQYIIVAQLLSVLVLGELRGVNAVFLTPLALLGVYLAVSGGGRLRLDGVMLAYGTAALWGGSVALLSYIVNDLEVSPITIAGLRAAILTPALTLPRLRGLRGISRRSLAFLGASGIISYVAGFVLFATAIKLAGPSISALATALTPVLTQLISAWAGGEPLSARRLGGSALVALAIALAIATA